VRVLTTTSLAFYGLLLFGDLRCHLLSANGNEKDSVEGATKKRLGRVQFHEM
jgi:hypothetical protein